MIEGRDIICFSNDWDSDPLSKKHIMSRLAKKNRILWVNSIANRRPRLSRSDIRRAWKKVRDFLRGTRRRNNHIFVYSPLVLPFHESRAARWVNRITLGYSIRRLCRKLGFRQPITWTFEPSSADVVGTLGEDLIVYHCVDEFSEFDGVNKIALAEIERRLLGKADLVIVSSNELFEHKSRQNPNTVLVTHGVDTEHFRRACGDSAAVAEELRHLPRPIIGFFGLIAPWVDLQLIKFIATARRSWSFVLVGNVVTDTAGLRECANVHFVGRRSYASLPAYCKGFDMAILPFVVNQLTRAANPLKLREYLAAGLPVVSTALPEAEKFSGIVRIGRFPGDFLHQMDQIVSQGLMGPRLEISKQMDRESWDEKVELMCRHVSKTIRSQTRREASSSSTPKQMAELAERDSLYVH